MRHFKVLLVDPSGWQKHSISSGLGYLTGMLLKHDIECRTLDLNNNAYSDDAILKKIGDYNPNLIGYSMKTATARSAARVANVVHAEFPGIYQIGGGPHITLYAEEFLRENPSFNFACSGDGEFLMLALCRQLEMNKTDFEIDGLSFFYRGKYVRRPHIFRKEIADYPFPVFNTIIDMDFTEFRYPLITSRGCPYKCVFCSVPKVGGNKFRQRPAEHVVEEIKMAMDRYRISKFEVLDDDFTLNMPRAKDICKLMIKENINLDWWCHNGIRADCVDVELAMLMKKAGCSSVAFGVESGDPNVFDRIKKGETVEDVIKGIRIVQKAGMRTVGYFIVGLPGDSIESTIKTVFAQRALNLDDHCYNMLVPYLGTEMLDIVRREGRMLIDPKEAHHFSDRDTPVAFEYNDYSAKEILAAYKLATRQDWVRGYPQLMAIKETFKKTYESPLKNVVVLAPESLHGLCDFIDPILGVKAVEISISSKDNMNPNLDELVLNRQAVIEELMGEGYSLRTDSANQSLWFEKHYLDEKERITGERLPSIKDWHNPTGGYYHTAIKQPTPIPAAEQSGVIYLNGKPIPYDPLPDFKTHPCGKIEGGTVFISICDYDATDIFTVDYFPMPAYKTYIKQIQQIQAPSLTPGATHPSGGYPAHEILTKWECIGDAFYKAVLSQGHEGGTGKPGGTIYRNGVPLPFHPFPEQAHYPCGKLHDNGAIISIAAYDPDAAYIAVHCGDPRINLCSDIDLPKIKECGLLIVPATVSGKIFAKQIRAKYVLTFNKAGAGPFEVDYARVKSLDRIGSRFSFAHATSIVRGRVSRLPFPAAKHYAALLRRKKLRLFARKAFAGASNVIRFITT